MGRAQGQESGDGMLGKVMGEIRRAFSVAVVRSQALCLLERLSQLGPGARAAAQRRQQTLGLEERKASICFGLPGERLGQSWQSIYTLKPS